MQLLLESLGAPFGHVESETASTAFAVCGTDMPPISNIPAATQLHASPVNHRFIASPFESFPKSNLPTAQASLQASSVPDGRQNRCPAQTRTHATVCIRRKQSAESVKFCQYS
jgi:hypothetical protein